MKVTALLKSTIGNFTSTVQDPRGKKYVYDFNAKNDWMVEVPTEMKYKTLSGKEEVFQENLAQHLLDSVKVTNRSLERFGLPVFELVEQKEHPVVETKITDKTKSKKSEKEKKDEKQAV